MGREEAYQHNFWWHRTYIFISCLLNALG